jgi:predicted Zn-dependent protease
MDDDYLGIRRALWISTDNVYRGASRQFARNQQTLKEKNKPLSEVPHRSFAKTEPSTLDVEASPMKFDRRTVEDYVRKVSAALNEFKELETGNVDFNYNRGYRYLVNSEGSMNRVPFSLASLSISVNVKTKEGKTIMDHQTFHLTAGELPPMDIAIATARDLAKHVISSLNGPKEFDEEYIGPVLIEGETATNLVGYQVMFSEALGAMPRYKPIGKGGEKVGKQIFPGNMTVKATPKLKKYGNEMLLGSFDVDDEGVVPADETLLVENGVVKNIMTTRSVNKADETSNGLGFGPGVLHVLFRNTVPANTLKALLIEAAKKEGLDYALMVKKSHDSQLLMSSIQVYKIYVADGREELAPNALLSGDQMSERTFRKIIAASNETMVGNLVWINGYVSVIAPQAIIMGEMEFGGDKSRIDGEENRETYVTSPRKK